MPAVPAKANYIYSILGVEILSILICLALLYGNIFENKEKTPRNRVFSYSVASCMLALAADAVSWIFDGCAGMKTLLYGSTLISLIMTFVMNIDFVYYIAYYVREKKPISFLLPHIHAAFSAVVILLTVVIAGSGKLFYFENGVYQEGAWYSGYLIANLACSALCLCVTLAHMRYMNVHDRVATILFVLLPFAAGCVNTLDEDFPTPIPRWSCPCSCCIS